MNRERFESLVARAVEALPEEFHQRLENIDVVVEDYPTRTQIGENQKGKDFILLGLYEGIPLTERDNHYGMVVPDKITIFQKNFELLYGADDFLIQKEIGKVVRHEVAHHFGISDERLDELEGREY
ncbi:MAG TPA: metallopeptidase family protein [Dehalococcoidales bacterium]|nr:metallopeptidase family protein [Dehalococcoidales bacterium]